MNQVIPIKSDGAVRVVYHDDWQAGRLMDKGWTVIAIVPTRTFRKFPTGCYGKREGQSYETECEELRETDAMLLVLQKPTDQVVADLMTERDEAMAKRDSAEAARKAAETERDKTKAALEQLEAQLPRAEAFARMEDNIGRLRRHFGDKAIAEALEE